MLFNSQGLNDAHRKYSPHERELLTVVNACDAFAVYLLGREFTHRTEHAALSAIYNSLSVQSVATLNGYWLNKRYEL